MTGRTYPTQCPTCGETVIVVVTDAFVPTTCTCGQVAIAYEVGGVDRINWSMPSVAVQDEGAPRLLFSPRD